MSASATTPVEVSADKNQWLQRVLGITVGQAAAPQRPMDGVRAWTVGKLAWQTASETVDGQITALTSLLREDPDPDMRAIADMGLNALTAGVKVGLMAAMMDLDHAPRDPAAIKKLRGAIAAFHNHLDSDDRIAACDECPDLQMSIRATLAEGLDALEAALDRAT